jgi:outer membrane lipoprotein-sorting protein
MPSGRRGDMKTFLALCGAIIFTAGVSSAFAQQPTTEQVLAKLDEKAKVFTSLETSVVREEFVVGTKTSEKGKMYLKSTKNGAPYALIDISEPKARATKGLVKDGSATLYSVSTNTYRRQKVDPKNDQFQLLLIGFGVPSSTIKKFYTPAVTGQETIDKVRAVVLELTPVTPQSSKFAKITLWLDPGTWTPVQTRLTEISKDYFDFRYSNVKLNKGVSDSIFKIDLPKNAKQQ